MIKNRQRARIFTIALAFVMVFTMAPTVVHATDYDAYDAYYNGEYDVSAYEEYDEYKYEEGEYEEIAPAYVPIAPFFAVTVTDEQGLLDALADTDVTIITISSEIEITATVVIDRRVVITGDGTLKAAPVVTAAGPYGAILRIEYDAIIENITIAGPGVPSAPGEWHISGIYVADPNAEVFVNNVTIVDMKGPEHLGMLQGFGIVNRGNLTVTGGSITNFNRQAIRSHDGFLNVSGVDIVAEDYIPGMNARSGIVVLGGTAIITGNLISNLYSSHPDWSTSAIIAWNLGTEVTVAYNVFTYNDGWYVVSMDEAVTRNVGNHIDLANVLSFDDCNGVFIQPTPAGMLGNVFFREQRTPSLWFYGIGAGVRNPDDFPGPQGHFDPVNVGDFENTFTLEVSPWATEVAIDISDLLTDPLTDTVFVVVNGTAHNISVSVISDPAYDGWIPGALHAPSYIVLPAALLGSERSFEVIVNGITFNVVVEKEFPADWVQFREQRGPDSAWFYHLGARERCPVVFPDTHGHFGEPAANAVTFDPLTNTFTINVSYDTTEVAMDFSRLIGYAPAEAVRLAGLTVGVGLHIYDSAWEGNTRAAYVVICFDQALRGNVRDDLPILPLQMIAAPGDYRPLGNINVVINRMASDAIPTIDLGLGDTVADKTVEIDNNGHVQIITVEGTAVSDIEISFRDINGDPIDEADLPEGVTVTLVNNVITVMGVRPAPGEAAVLESFIVVVEREGTLCGFIVEVDLTPFAAPIEDEGAVLFREQRPDSAWFYMLGAPKRLIEPPQFGHHGPEAAGAVVFNPDTNTFELIASCEATHIVLDFSGLVEGRNIDDVVIRLGATLLSVAPAGWTAATDDARVFHHYPGGWDENEYSTYVVIWFPAGMDLRNISSLEILYGERVGYTTLPCGVRVDGALVAGYETVADFNIRITRQEQTVTVGAASAALTVGTAGTVTFPVTTTCIPDGYYYVAVANLPPGLTAVPGPIMITNGVGTLTVTGTPAANTAGTHDDLVLTLTSQADPTLVLESNEFTLVINPAQQGGIWGGGGGDPVVVEEEDPPLGPFIGDHIWYIRGFPDGSFRPGQSITRAEVAMILWRLLDSDAKYAQRGNNFHDVSTGWYARAVSYLAFRDIVTGYPDGSFRPNNPITRAELTAMMSRFFEMDETAANNFTDVSATHWAILYINNAHNKGWIEGDGGGTFRPNDATTRAEAVTIINRVLDRIPNPQTINYHLENSLYDAIGVHVLFNDITSTHWAFFQVMEAAITHDFDLDAQGREVWSMIEIPWFELTNPAL